MEILVLGGTGFIGAHLVPRLLADGHGVTVLNRGNSKSDSAVLSLQADRDDAMSMQQALEPYTGSEFEAVIDTSSLCLLHTQVLLAQLPQFTDHLIHISSASVYLECQMAKETDPIGGTDIWGDYAAAKSEVDSFLLDQSHGHPFRATIYRPPYLYGPNDSQDRASFVWSQIKDGLPVFVPPTTEDVLIQFLHVADLVRAITKSLRSAIAPGVYNIAGKEKVGLSQWVALVAEVAGMQNSAKEAPTDFQDKPARSYFPFRSTTLTLDVAKLAGQGHAASTSLVEGLETTHEDYCRQIPSRR